MMQSCAARGLEGDEMAMMFFYWHHQLTAERASSVGDVFDNPRDFVQGEATVSRVVECLPLWNRQRRTPKITQNHPKSTKDFKPLLPGKQRAVQINQSIYSTLPDVVRRGLAKGPARQPEGVWIRSHLSRMFIKL